MRHARRRRPALVLAIALAGACGEAPVRYVSTRDGGRWSAPVRWAIPPGGAAVVTNSGESSVTVVDLARSEVLAVFSIGVGPLARNGPHHLGIDLRRGQLYAPLSFPAPPIATGPHAAHGSAQVPGILVKRDLWSMRLLARADVDPNPGDMALSPDLGRVFVSHFDLRRALENPGSRAARLSNLVVLDAVDLRRQHSVPVCVAAHGMALAPDGRTAYLACFGDDAMGIVDLGDGTLAPAVSLVPIAGAAPADGRVVFGPYALVMSRDGRTLWAGCTEQPVLIPFDAQTRRWRGDAALRLLGRPYFPGFSADGRRMYVPMQNRDGLAVVALGDQPTLERQATFAAEQCVLPHQAAIGPDGALYLLCEGVHTTTRAEPGTLLVLDPQTLAVRRTIAVGVFPDAIAFLGAGR